MGSLFARSAPSLWQEAQRYLRPRSTSPGGLAASVEVDPAQLELVIQEMRKTADGQWETWKQADTRIQFLLGLAASMLTIGLATGLGHGFASSPSRLLVAAGVVSIAAAALCLVAAYRSDRFVNAGGKVQFAQLAVSSSPQATREAVVLRLARAQAANDRALRLKLRRSRRGLLLLAIGGLAGLAAVLRPSAGTD